MRLSDGSVPRVASFCEGPVARLFLGDGRELPLLTNRPSAGGLLLRPIDVVRPKPWQTVGSACSRSQYSRPIGLHEDQDLASWPLPNGEHPRRLEIDDQFD